MVTSCMTCCIHIRSFSVVCRKLSPTGNLSPLRLRFLGVFLQRRIQEIQEIHACLVPRLSPHAILQAMESGVGPGNEASVERGQYGEAMHEFRAMSCRLRIYSAGCIAQGNVTKFTDGCVCEQLVLVCKLTKAAE